MISQLLGGIGLFLLGILLLTDGLKTATGEALKRILSRFTGHTTSAFFSGITLTAMVQSSSATTLATIGFVSAGLLTFSQAIGVIIGSSVGTTTTGWIVAVAGLKFSMSAVAMPLVGIGALMRLLLKGRGAPAGLALAGFGLIFIGIETLQLGMDGLAVHLRPEAFPAPTFTGRLLLMFIGLGLTVVMQASSAAVATAITAYHSGTLDLAQALALVVGTSIGTTLTSALAAIGASVSARRTALVHVLFNTLAAALGFALLPAFIWAVTRWATPPGAAPGAWTIAAFHTFFQLVGAAVALPGVRWFSRVVIRLLPEREPMPTRHLDDSLAQVPEVALEAVRRALVESTLSLATWLQRRLTGEATVNDAPLTNLRASLDECYTFLSSVPATVSIRRDAANPRLSLIHALDHLDQLLRDLSIHQPLPAADASGRLAAASGTLRDLLNALPDLAQTTPNANLPRIEQLATQLAELRRTGRHALLQETADAGLAPAAADRLLDAVRWMDTSAYHLWRTAHHLTQAADGTPTS